MPNHRTPSNPVKRSQPTPHRRLKLEIACAIAAPPGLAPFLRRHIRLTHALLESPLADLSIALVGDAQMSRLHKQFLKKPGPTDVLTFELSHDSHNRPTSGEIVVCLPHARRAMARHSVPLRLEVLLYCIHGMLHLHGYDDRHQRDYKLMHRTEDNILSRLGLPAAFASGSRVSP